MEARLFEIFANIEERHWWFVGRRRIMRAILDRFLTPSTGQLVIDVGCGTGGNIASLATEFRCRGLDGSSNAIAWARKRFPDVEFVHVGMDEDLRGRLAGASAVLCMDVIEHIEREIDFVRMLVDAMDVGSILLLTVPADMSLWGPHDEVNGHFRRYTRTELGATWAGLPVRVRLSSYFNYRLYFIVKALRAIARMLGRPSGADSSDFSIPPELANSFLERVFEGEKGALLSVLDKDRSAYARGVSLVAVLERTAT